MRAPQQQPDRQLCHCAQWRFTEGVNQDNYNAVSNVNGTLPVTTRPSSGGGSSNSGNKTESTKNPDGSQEVVETKKDGNVVSLATLSQSAVEAAQEKGEAVTLPMPEVSVTADLPVDGSVKVEISVENVTPDTAMTCAMIVTVLDRFEGVDTTTGDIWYEAEQQWAVANGVSDGTTMDGSLTREQLAAMLWRYAGSPSVSNDLSGYTDAGTVFLRAAGHCLGGGAGYHRRHHGHYS